MTRLPLAAAALVALGGAAGRAWASGGGAGTTGAPILQLPIGARAAGMGTAFTAVADDVSALHYNPAGLASLSHREASLMYMSGQERPDVEHMAFGSPLGFTGFTGAGYSSLAGSLLLSQNGQIEYNRTNPDGTLASTQKLDAGGDLVASIGYAERIADTVFETPDTSWRIQHFLGVSGKYVRSTLANSYSAQTGAADFGYLARAPEKGLSFGAAVTNLGGRLRYIEVGDPLPLTMRAGGAWSIPMPATHGLVWAADYEYQYHEKQWFANTGLEYTLLKQWAARVGYQVHRDLAGLTIGFGVRWLGWGIDYAWAMNSDLGDNHRFSFNYRFGAVAQRQREKVRRTFIESVPDDRDMRELEQERPQTYDAPKRPRRTAPENRGAPGWIY